MIPESYNLKDAVVFTHFASFFVRTAATTGKEKQKPHEDVSDMDDAEKWNDDNEEKREDSDVEIVESAEVFGWMRSASANPVD